MAEAQFQWTRPDGANQRGAHVRDLGLRCPACEREELTPLAPEDGAPPAPHGADFPRRAVCGGCDAVVPLGLQIRLPGYLVRLGKPELTGPERGLLVAGLPQIFAHTHHPWRQAIEREAALADHRFGELPDIRKAMTVAGEMGGGVACPGCGKKPLQPHSHPGQDSYFRTQVGLWLACDGCHKTWTFAYSLDADTAALHLETREAGPDAAQAGAYSALYQLLLDEDVGGFWRGLEVLPEITPEHYPGLGRLVALARALGGDDPPIEALPAEPRRPLLRRLGDRSPLFGETSWSVTCAESPKVRLAGRVLHHLVEDMGSKAARRGAAGILEDIALWNGRFPYLIKTKPVSQLLAQGLLDLRRRLRESGVHLLPVAGRDGLLLVDPRDGRVAFRLPHMQPAASEPPVALGFMNRMVYYEEGGELAVTGHPLVAGTAWRTGLDGPAVRWFDLGRYTVVETEAGLAELSGSSGRVRWSRTRDDLGGLVTWTVSGSGLVVAGEESLQVIDPATGETLVREDLPRRARLLALLTGDVPGPAAVIDQGYGAGIFAPRAEDIKGVKPIAGPVDGGGTELAYAACERGQVVTLWKSEFGYAERGICIGPLEKKFAAKGVLVETQLAFDPSLTLWDDGRFVVVPGSPVAVLDAESGEVVHLLEADARRGLRSIGGILLALGVDSLAAVDPTSGAVAWRLEVPELQAIDAPGPCLTPVERRPGFTPPLPTDSDPTEASASKEPDVP